MTENQRKSRWFQRWGILILLFLLAFLPRAIYPVSRPAQWYSRVIRFGDALLAGDWAGTYIRYHPGVTTMWLSGTSLKLFATKQGLSSGQLMGIERTTPGTLDDPTTVGVLPLAFVVALCIALAYSLLCSITGRKVALVGRCLLALDPFYITYSKVLHVDALLASFMLVSVLFLFNYLQRARRSDLILSGVFAGLAGLSKSSAIFLIPYAALVVGMYKPLPLGGASWRRWGRWLWGIARTLLIWGGVAAVVFILLWPAMWVQPLDAVRKMGERIIFHVTTLHRNPIFFNGQVTFEDPGLLFYLATIAWKTTLVTLPMLCTGLLFALLQSRGNSTGRFVRLLVAFVFFFTLQMGLSARKELRYLLPVFPVLDLIAAFGLVQIAQAAGRIRRWRKWSGAPTLVMALLLALQAYVALSRHPYYGTHHNALLGGSKVAQHILQLQDQGEGLDLAGQFLSTLPRAQSAKAAIHDRGGRVFQRTFAGARAAFDDPEVDYRVYFVNQVMRGLGRDDWEEAWKVDRRGEPLWTVAFDGVPYVWVYGTPPDEPAAGGPEHELHYRLGEQIRLKRVRLSAEIIAPGNTLTAVLFWESDRALEKEYTVFCHILSSSGELVAQHDGLTLGGVRPMSSWRAGELIQDIHGISFGHDLAPEEYELSVGMYDYETMERLAVYDAAGKRMLEDRMILANIRVESP